MKKHIIRDLIGIAIFLSMFLIHGLAQASYVLTVFNTEKTAELFQYFTSFEDCRAARATLLSVYDRYDDFYFITCVPEVES